MADSFLYIFFLYVRSFLLVCSVAHHQSSQIVLYINTHIWILKMTPEAEKFNGWAAMLGFVAAFGAYATTGQIIPGIF